VSVTLADKLDQKLASVLVPEKMNWDTARQSIWKCKTRIEKIGGSRVDTEPTAWVLDAPFWNLLWTGEQAMKKGIPIFKKAGFESVEDLPSTVVGFGSKAYQDLPPGDSSGCLQRRMVSQKLKCVYPMRKKSTVPPNFLRGST